jgi:purine-nucleoside/S-methyl-5'-thioadenosine phosphorylase / adenosine deaminase
MTLMSPLLAAIPGVRHAFFTREGGVSDGIYHSLNGGLGSNDDPARISENRRRMAERMGVAPDHLLSLHQTHSPDVVTVSGPWQGSLRPRADALVTRSEGLAIGVTAADCGPILFADPAARVIGAAHAGWRGAFTGVIEATVAAMEKLGAKRARIAAALGPAIRQPNYEVGAEFVARFTAADAANARFFAAAARDGHAMFDLTGYIAERVHRAGIDDFEDLGLCTCAEPDRFFSYRRMTKTGEADYGRHINAITLTG